MGGGDTHAGAVGCVNYLNARPLIEGLETHRPVLFDAPSGLRAALVDGRVDAALCPVVDAVESPAPLSIIPSGAIGCADETLTVRLFARRPVAELEQIAVDPDSRTSVALLRVLLAERFGRRPALVPLAGRSPEPEALLLIGDKVVTDPPGPAHRYGWDLGRAWRETTGLPFVFAAWMRRADVDPGDLPELLDSTRRRNADRRAAIAEKWAAHHGWPLELARRYLGSILRYELDDAARAGLDRFLELARRHDAVRPPPAG